MRMLRTSERADFKRCPQRWWWGWRMGLKPNGPPSDALWFGTGWHLAMAHWYCGPGLTRGADPLKVWKDYVRDEVRFVRTIPYRGAEYQEEKYVEAGELGQLMLENYFNTYGNDDDCHMIAPEQTFQVQVRVWDSDSYIINAGTFDGVFRDSAGHLWLWEHKTAKAIRVDHLNLDDQGGGYWAVATTTLRDQGLIGPNESLKGIMYNFARKAAPDTRPVNDKGQHCNKPKKEHYIAALEGVDGWAKEELAKKKLDELEGIAAAHMFVVLGDVSANQPPPFFKREPVFRTKRERNTQIERIGQEAAVMDMYRSGELPLFKTPTKDCNFCNFYELCKIDEISKQDADEYIKMAFRVKDPYADHRKSAAAME